MITKKGFKIIYPPRKIDSIYFENLDLHVFMNLKRVLYLEKNLELEIIQNLRLKNTI